MSKTILAVALTAAFAFTSASPMLGQSRRAEQEDRARDPVCNLVVKKDPELSARHGGQVYYFCMKADMEEFRRNPERFLGNREHSHPEPKR